jgi:hypothetical protein
MDGLLLSGAILPVHSVDNVQFNGGSMKKNLLILAVCALALSFCAKAFAVPFASPSIGGPTGLITTPTAQIGWDGNDIAVDGGAHYISPDEGDSTIVYKANVSLFRRLELGAAYDAQKGTDNEDFLVNAKLRFYPWDGAGKSALALGGRYMMMNFNSNSNDYKKYQLYLAATYGGDFFGLPAETTIVVGKTFGSKKRNDDKDNIDFSMGFDLDMFPNILKGYVHWISDFGNYSYSYEAVGADAWYRGAFNTGARVAVFKDLNRFKLNIDALILDALDKNRSWSIGVSGGAAF